IWLLFVLGLEAGPNAALAAGATLAVLLAVLAWRDRVAAYRRVSGAAAIALAILAVLVPALHSEAVPVPITAVPARPDLWRPFDAAELRKAVAEGQIVFVDVTAAWCLTCKANELAVLDREPVAGKLQDPGVVAMRADWTRPDPIITGYLQSFGRYG